MMKRPCQNTAPIDALTIYPGRKLRSRGRAWWITAALIVVFAFFASVPANAQINASLVTSIADGTDLSSYDFPSAAYSNDVLYIAFTSTACASGQDCGLGVDMVAAVESVSGAGHRDRDTWRGGLQHRRAAYPGLAGIGHERSLHRGCHGYHGSNWNNVFSNYLSLNGCGDDRVHGHEDQRHQRC
jgi:hypothetical protein